MRTSGGSWLAPTIPRARLRLGYRRNSDGAGAYYPLVRFVTGLLAAVFGSIGGIWLLVERRAAAFTAELRATGRRIQAKMVEIERRRNIHVGSRNPYRVFAQWEDPTSNTVYVFRSANIWFDPTPYVGETIEVLVDRNDPRRHLIELESLPKLAS